MRNLAKILPVLLVSLSIMLVPLPAAAWNPLSNAPCNKDTASSAVCTGKNSTANPLYGPNSTIVTVTQFIGMIAGIAAVIMLIIGAMRYVLAGGDAKDIASAKNTIIYALVGLAVIVSATAIITFVVSQL